MIGVLSTVLLFLFILWWKICRRREDTLENEFKNVDLQTVITGHSLAIDESSMTGESKIVHKDSTREPFLMSGCKVDDGYGTVLVTSVGINTEWGLLMESISEDNGEEKPLQVWLNGVATFIGFVGLAVAVLVLGVLVAWGLNYEFSG